MARWRDSSNPCHRASHVSLVGHLSCNVPYLFGCDIFLCSGGISDPARKRIPAISDRIPSVSGVIRYNARSMAVFDANDPLAAIG
jgi:hypothetical protein